MDRYGRMRGAVSCAAAAAAAALMLLPAAGVAQGAKVSGGGAHAAGASHPPGASHPSGASHPPGASHPSGVSGGSSASTRAAAVSVIQPWVRSTRAGQRNAAGYLEVRAPDGDRLIGARLPAEVAARVELHSMRMNGDVMVMREVDSFDVGAGRSLVLAPGGNHLMLMDLKKPLSMGESVDAVLVFEKAGEVPVRMAVRDPPAAAGGHGSQGGAGHGSQGGAGQVR